MRLSRAQVATLLFALTAASFGILALTLPVRAVPERPCNALGKVVPPGIIDPPEEDRCDVSSQLSPCSRVSWLPGPQPPE